MFFNIYLRNYPGILLNALIGPGTFMYQDGVPATTGPGYRVATNQISGFTLSPTSGYATVVSSDHGDFDINNPPPGFHPTVFLRTILQMKLYGLDLGDYIILNNSGVGITTIAGPQPGYPSGLYNVIVNMPDYRSYSHIITDIYTLSIYDNNFNQGLPLYPGAPPGWSPISDLGLVPSGFYDIISTQWVLKNLTRPSLGTTFIAGDTGIFTTDPVGGYDFTTITSVKTANRTITTFDTQTPTEVTFTVTEDDDDPKPVEAAGTQFSGWAVINPITVYAANKSGIYKVVANKTHDTIYLSSGNINTTENVAIPDPMAKTGFIGG